jgi:hypothetical protein
MLKTKGFWRFLQEFGVGKRPGELGSRGIGQVSGSGVEVGLQEFARDLGLGRTGKGGFGTEQRAD